MVRSVRRARLTYVSRMPGPRACVRRHEVRQRTWPPRRSRGVAGHVGHGGLAQLDRQLLHHDQQVEGNKVYGRSERPATGKSGESNWNFVGTLAENVVIVKTPDLAWS